MPSLSTTQRQKFHRILPTWLGVVDPQAPWLRPHDFEHGVGVLAIHYALVHQRKNNFEFLLEGLLDLLV
jgi:hypothetical protein